MPAPWRVVALLCLVSGVSYLTRADVAVAQERMAPALGLTMTAMGAITAWGYQLPYTLFQIPGGMLGEWMGPRGAMLLALAGGALASLGAGLMPETPAAATITLWLTRILLGTAQAAVYPVAAMTVMTHVPADRRVRATSYYIATAALGAAAAPLLMAPVMERFGWRAVFLTSAGIGIVAAMAWWALMPAAPSRSAPKGRADEDRRRLWHDLGLLLRDTRLVRLSAAYVLHSAVWFVFVFWFFNYLTEGRGFTVLASGVWGSLPTLAGMVFAPIFGAATDGLGRRIGTARARRRMAMGCLLGAAAFVGAGAVLPGAVLAITALSLSSACINGAEAPFFMTATTIGQAAPGTAGGILNLMGNIGGVLSIWLVPHMAAAWGWNGTLAFWSAACVLAALLWLTVRVDEGSDPFQAGP